MIDYAYDYKKIKPNYLLALCEIPNYQEFALELSKLIGKDPGNRFNAILKILNGKHLIGRKKVKTFVEKYYDIFNILEEYDCKFGMTIFNQINKSKYDISYFDSYIKIYNKNIFKIRSIAQKLLDLGIEEIYFCSEAKFNDKDFLYNFNTMGEFNLLENMEIIPTYDNNSVRYKSNNSCYQIIFNILPGVKEGYISMHNSVIIINDLLVDINRIPGEISLEKIEQIKNKKESNECLRDLVDIRISYDELLKQYQKTKEIFETKKGLKDEKIIKEILCDIYKSLEKLKITSMEHENNILEDKEKLDSFSVEKETYLVKKNIY